jgi:hypothetical protein
MYILIGRIHHEYYKKKSEHFCQVKLFYINSDQSDLNKILILSDDNRCAVEC